MNSYEPRSKKNSLFALVDCNNFYVSCERAFNPKFKKVPTIVLSNNDGCAVSMSEEAKTLGIPRGKPAFQFQDIIEKHQIQVLSSNYALYGDMSRRIMNILSQMAPKVEIYSIDEAFLDLEHLPKNEILSFAYNIKEKLYRWTGIPVSIGIGKTKTQAKLANSIAKRDKELYNGVFDLASQTNIDSFLSETETRKVWGVGSRYSKMLAKNEIFNALQLKNADDRFILKNMTIVGLKTVWELRGISCIDLEECIPAKKAIISSRSFGRPITELKDLKEAVAYYSIKASEKLRVQKSLAKVLTLFLETNSFRSKEPQYSNSITIRFPFPSSNTSYIIKEAHKLLDKIYKADYKYKKAGLYLNDLYFEKDLQLDFFYKQNPKNEKVMALMDEINQKFGNLTLRPLSMNFKHRWGMRQENLSPHYTTNWDNLLSVK